MNLILAKIGQYFLDLIETIVMALALFVVAYLFLFQPHQVKGNSMFPNYHDAEFVLSDKVTYRFSKPQRGDVIIFRSPQNKEQDYIKRVIALPNETIRIENGSVFINNQKLNEKYLPLEYFTSAGTFLLEAQEFTVPINEFFVLGDNRSHSSDSREFGPIKKEEIIGRAFLRYWPIPKIGLLPKVTY